ncbi:coniferyl-aldehyde dehydrogenase [Aquaspirillum sp. LM1]|uniref:coniferyl aldehyde dehydrogenase n=1 Tax=Aquaspirillum sp. LM1 TaxID=1938604 RepID=UPI000983B910|nr:coniferyl aldehyde dehydrogenase [Aquaspirillum sp. LM1]AQR64785.1 coniferyl-aldehyde dehydrogenase [Aquaspirillum sp. LM1]
MPAPRLLCDPAELPAALAASRAAWQQQPYPDLACRRARLQRLHDGLLRHADALAAAISRDFGQRSVDETRVAELFPALQGIAYAQRHLRRWMRAQRRGLSPWFWPARAEVQAQPLGVVGIIVPWNYPLYLAIGPLTDALAAGNQVMIKMSEYTPATAHCLAQLLAEVFPAGEVQLALGEVAMARAFAALPFDHLLFTGSTAVGRQVMQAASANLTPVTLELGGKSPTLIAPGYPIAQAAACIAQGKLMNAGQTCVAPDYVLLPRAALAEFVQAFAQAVARSYPTLADNPDYSTIIHRGQLDRLQGYLDQARAAGAQWHACLPAAETEAQLRAVGKLAPQLLWAVPDGQAVLEEEIFGPILPLLVYDELADALAWIQARPRPLALYLFDHDRARIRQVLKHTHAGGVVINDTLLHVVQDSLPFGGVGASGMGQYHGHHGFLTFSTLKPVLYQARLNAMPLLRPPYGRLLRWLQTWMIR